MYNSASEALYCTDCRRTTEVVLDHASGDTICTECALVLEAHYIDETSEWRTFADDDGAEDPCRVGLAGDPFLNVELTTVVTYSGPPNSQAKSGDIAALARMHDVGPAPDKTLVDAFGVIADMADRLGLVATIRDRAKEVFKKLDEAKACPRIRNRDAVYAACLYIACRNEGKPRTYKELASVTAEGPAARKEIGKLTKIIKKRLGEEDGQVMDTGVVHAADYLRRFCSLLGLGNQEVRAAQEATRRLEASLDVRRNPDSIAAAIIYMVVERTGAGKSVKDVSMATGVAQNTIKEAHKDLTPHAELLFG